MGGQMGHYSLQNRFETALIAICTKGMKRFTVFAAFFQNVVVKSSVNISTIRIASFLPPMFQNEARVLLYVFTCSIAAGIFALERRVICSQRSENGRIPLDKIVYVRRIAFAMLEHRIDTRLCQQILHPP